MTDNADNTHVNNSGSVRRLSKNQMLTLASTASLNFSSMICYSILGPFFPQEAVKKGLGNTVIGFIFGCFALFNFTSSLIFGRYLVQIGAKFMFVSGLLVSGVATVLFGDFWKYLQGLALS
ncbi:MFS-type transporter SLC18B1 [Pyxicephalus adspersus]|uniref:MFS-type transporter SLC18B1 n=1 Tax=Pyxicephalus adspersus TaxID=30357 RepID=UPI003B5BE26E